MTIKSFLLPNEAVSAKRRKDVFGTESKAVAGIAITAVAAAAIVGGASVAKLGVIGAAKQAGTKALTLIPKTTKGKLTALALTPPALGILSNKNARGAVAETAVRYPGESYRFSKGATEGVSQALSGDYKGGFETFKQAAKENPIGAVGTGVISGALVGTAVFYAGKISSAFDNSLETDLLKKNALLEYENKIKTLPNSVPDERIIKENKLLPPNPAVPPPSFIDDKKTQQTGTATQLPPSTSSAVPVNIQQNNYFGDKVITKYIN